MKVDLLNLQELHAPLQSALEEALLGVVRSGRYILGPEVARFEEAVAQYCGAQEAIGVSSGTDALLACLMALDVGPGDRVVTSPFTFVATADVIVRRGAEPVFVDLEPDGFNMDPERLADVLDAQVKAIMPVHLFGRMCDMKTILAQAEAVPVIEDAAQSLGARQNGQGAGAVGTCGCFSFFPSKNLGGLGDGGMVVTSDPELADKVRILRAHGGKSKRCFEIVGGNFRLDALQAAALRVKLAYLDRWSVARRKNALRYRALFCEAFDCAAESLPFKLPELPELPEHDDPDRIDGGQKDEDSPGANNPKIDRAVFNQFAICTQRRDALADHLKQHDIGCAVYYRTPLHLEPCFGHLGYGPGSFPRAEKVSQEVLALPVHPTLTRVEQEYVVDTIAKFFQAQ
jgi:dTDP-4-amino-4,6-dideoxygalactose transaminase